MIIFGVILILFGGLVTFGNWSIAYQWYRYKRSSSFIPFMGGFFLAIGLYCVYPTIYAFLTIFADPATYSLLWAIPLLIRNAWQTSNFRIAHQLTAKSDIASYTLKLFNGGAFLIKIEFNPPQTCNEQGVKILADNMQGKWTHNSNSFQLTDYRENRKATLIEIDDSTYHSKESNYPEDKQYKYDLLDNIEFQAAAGGEML